MPWALQGGKAQEVAQMTNGKGGCICYHNADVSTICGANLRDGDLEWMLNQFTSGKTEITLKELQRERPDAAHNAGCDYCYAMSTNVGSKFTPSNLGVRLDRADKKSMLNSFEQRKPKQIRIGKSTEPGYTHTRERLLYLLDLCQPKAWNNGIQPIIITKTLEINDDVFERVAKARGSVLYSIGSDELENGPVSQGFSNEWRVSTAIKAQKHWGDRVRIGITAVVDASLSMTENTQAGFYGPTAVERAQAEGVYTRIIAIRYQGRLKPEAVHGHGRQELRSTTASLYAQREKAYFEQRGNSSLISPVVHEDWEPWEQRHAACGIMGAGFNDDGLGQYKEQCDQCALPTTDGGWNQSAVPIPRNNLIRGQKPIAVQTKLTVDKNPPKLPQTETLFS